MSETQNTTSVDQDPNLRKYDDLLVAFNRLAEFQGRMGKLRTAVTIDEALDNMELLLDEVVESEYMRLYLRNDDGTYHIERAFCPEEQELDWELAEWTLNKGEVSLVPQEGPDGEARSILFLPLVGYRGPIGVVVVWVEFGSETFTLEFSVRLGILARETAAIMEAIQMHASIEDAHARLAAVVEAVPLGIVSTDPLGCMRHINGTAEVMLELRRDKMTGHPIWENMRPEIANVLRGVCRNTGSPEEIEIDHAVGGAEHSDSIGITSAPLYRSSDGGVDGYVIVCRDLKLSREVVKLRELDAMKNDFISLVSHELRTPLTSIMAYSETLLMEGMIDTEEERNEYLQVIHSEGERLARLINDVLDLTKMESGKLDYFYEELDIHMIIQQSLAAVHSLSSQKNMHMPVECADDLPRVHVDSDRIAQVLINLYSNAIKFTDEGGTVETKAMLDTSDVGQKVLHISVRDTGIGISPENIHKVFSKFEQIESVEYHSQGTGLGMPICQQIIELGHAGQIWIESELGVGTTVHVTLPINR